MIMWEFVKIEDTPRPTYKKLGEGTYGKIMTTSDPHIVFKKWRKCQDDVIPTDFIREFVAASAIQSNDHKPLAISLTPLGIYYPRYQMNLNECLSLGYFKGNQTKTRIIMKSLLQIMEEAHHKGISHRDLKTPNILISLDEDPQIRVAICDWGMSAFHGSYRHHCVQTLWWRAPEVLLMDKYDHRIDIWSLGLIYYEIMVGVPLVRGQNEFDQFKLICKITGDINEKNYPGLTNTPGYIHLKRNNVWPHTARDVTWQEKLDPRDSKIVSKMLDKNQKKRPECSDLLCDVTAIHDDDLQSMLDGTNHAEENNKKADDVKSESLHFSEIILIPVDRAHMIFKVAYLLKYQIDIVFLALEISNRYLIEAKASPHRSHYCTSGPTIRRVPKVSGLQQLVNSKRANTELRKDEWTALLIATLTIAATLYERSVHSRRLLNMINVREEMYSKFLVDVLMRVPSILDIVPQCGVIDPKEKDKWISKAEMYVEMSQRDQLRDKLDKMTWVPKKRTYREGTVCDN